MAQLATNKHSVVPVCQHTNDADSLVVLELRRLIGDLEIASSSPAVASKLCFLLITKHYRQFTVKYMKHLM